jgi:hypothetical protein
VPPEGLERGVLAEHWRIPAVGAVCALISANALAVILPVDFWVNEITPAGELGYDGFYATDRTLSHPMRQRFRGIERREAEAGRCSGTGKHASVERLGKGNLL